MGLQRVRYNWVALPLPFFFFLPFFTFAFTWPVGPEQKSADKQNLRTGRVRRRFPLCLLTQDGSRVWMWCMEQRSLAAILNKWSDKIDDEGLCAENGRTQKWKELDPWGYHCATELTDLRNVKTLFLIGQYLLISYLLTCNWKCSKIWWRIQETVDRVLEM